MIEFIKEKTLHMYTIKHFKARCKINRTESDKKLGFNIYLALKNKQDKQKENQ